MNKTIRKDCTKRQRRYTPIRTGVIGKGKVRLGSGHSLVRVVSFRFVSFFRLICVFVPNGSAEREATHPQKRVFKSRVDESEKVRGREREREREREIRERYRQCQVESAECCAVLTGGGAVRVERKHDNTNSRRGKKPSGKNAV